MEIEALEKFLDIAVTENLQRSADRLDMTPGGLSKILRRLEGELGVRLFERVGKQLKINDEGRRLQSRASEIVTLARKARVEVGGLGTHLECRIAAPAMLQLTWAAHIQKQVTIYQPNIRLSFISAFESLALKMLIRGEVDMALISGVVLGQVPSSMEVHSIGSTCMCIAAGPEHPLASGGHSEVVVTLDNILQYPFAAPRISPFCGEERGIGSDGWPEDLFSRKIHAVVNDYGVLCRLVMQAELLAFLPEALVDEMGGVKLKVEGGRVQSQEDLFIVWRGGDGSWLDKLIGFF
ncbi:HTH-type transcriptional regulator HdfR [Microbulbifer sp. NBRC 101763]|uniref:LysR family transcriptional regulator n=1 Tax=Microbulbifer sp. NBRC 101763 TaxID=1113820 RepID=UPI0030B76418